MIEFVRSGEKDSKALEFVGQVEALISGLEVNPEDESKQQQLSDLVLTFEQSISNRTDFSDGVLSKSLQSISNARKTLKKSAGF